MQQIARHQCQEDEEEGRTGLGVYRLEAMTSSHSDTELTNPPPLPALGAHISPFDTALGSTQVPTESTNFVKDKTGHSGLPGFLRGQGDPRLSQKIKKRMKKCLYRAIKVMHFKCLI